MLFRKPVRLPDPEGLYLIEGMKRGMTCGPELVIVSSLPAVPSGEDGVILSRKFISGVEEHQRLWPGPVRVVMEPAVAETDNLDNVAMIKDELGFELSVMRFDSAQIANTLQGASLVMLLLYHRQTALAALCKRLGIPCIYTAEYSLRTRVQIARTMAGNSVRFALKALLEVRREQASRRAVGLASGVQCNGTPTYKAYRRLNDRTMLFFDTRVHAAMIPDEADLRQRFAARRARGRLRLVFSGRLVAMKGVDHLLPVATALRKTGRAFELFICGAGTLEPAMQRDAERQGLGGTVHFKGNLDFEQELMPFMREQVDLFVCPHRQGDPSCTYLETMACGVPIVGYDNEAFLGLISASGAGWSTSMNRPEMLAQRIASLSDDEIEDHSMRSLVFARERTFANEFERRMAHARAVAGVRDALAEVD